MPLTELPADVLQHIVVRLTLAHHIARVAPTCRVVSVAVRNAFKVRPFTGEVVTLAGNDRMWSLAVAPGGRVVACLYTEVKVWRDGACERTIKPLTVTATSLAVLYSRPTVAVLPGAEPTRFVTGTETDEGLDEHVQLWTLDGTLERTFEMGSEVHEIAALPDGMHFVVGIGYPREEVDEDDREEDAIEVRLYHVDGTLVHAFTGHTDTVWAVAVTPDGQHIISGSSDDLVKVWSVASKSLVSTCIGHTEGIRTVAAMPDGQRLLSGGGPTWSTRGDFAVRVWLLDGTLKNTFSELHTRGVSALVALPDNQHALSGSGDQTVKLFNVDDGAILRTFTHHTNTVICLALLPGGLRFVSGSDDGTVCIVEHGLALQ